MPVALRRGSYDPDVKQHLFTLKRLSACSDCSSRLAISTPNEAASVVTWASGTKADASEVLARKSLNLWAAAAAAIVPTRTRSVGVGHVDAGSRSAGRRSPASASSKRRRAWSARSALPGLPQ